MKRYWLLGLILSFSVGILRAQSQSDCIPLKSEHYNWPKDFDELNVQLRYSPIRLSRLKPFFYNGSIHRECISVADLQELSTAVRYVFKGEKDRSVREFVMGITSWAKTNRFKEHATPTADTNGSAPVPVDIAEQESPIVVSSYQLEQKLQQIESPRLFWIWVSVALGVLLLGLGSWILVLRKQKAYFEKNSRVRLIALEMDLRHNFEINKAKLSYENRELKQINDELIREIAKLARQMEPASLPSSSSIKPDEFLPLAQAELEKREFKSKYEEYLKRNNQINKK